MVFTLLHIVRSKPTNRTKILTTDRYALEWRNECMWRARKRKSDSEQKQHLMIRITNHWLQMHRLRDRQGLYVRHASSSITTSWYTRNELYKTNASHNLVMPAHNGNIHYVSASVPFARWLGRFICEMVSGQTFHSIHPMLILCRPNEYSMHPIHSRNIHRCRIVHGACPIVMFLILLG